MMAFALPEVNTPKQELRPMIVTKIIIFPNLTFIHLRWPKLAFKYIFMHKMSNKWHLGTGNKI